MKLRSLILINVALSLAIAGCGKKGSDQQDVEAQIRSVIQTRVSANGNLNPQAFDTVVNSVTINGDHAQAQVDFRLKNGPGVMQLNYQLEKRQGNWVVVDSNPVGAASPHPSVDQNQNPIAGDPGAHAGASHSLSDTLREFQQEAPAGSSPTLPPGHPPVNQTGSGNHTTSE